MLESLQRQLGQIAHIAYQCICRQEKSKQLANLQSELHLLDSDIKQVAGRQPALPAATPELPQLQLPSRQHSTQLLQERLQEGVPSTAKQALAVSTAGGIHDRPPAIAASAAASPAAPPQHLQPAAGIRPMPSGTLPQATPMAATPAMPAHHYLMQPLQPQAERQPQPQPGIILAQHSVSQPPESSQQPGNTAAAGARQTLQPRLARASNGYLMINHPTSAAATQQQLPAGTVAAASARGSAATSTTGSAGTAAASGRHASGVPLPTQMERQQSMHIHPRHLAFQHFHALQQRQQMAPQNSAGPAAASASQSTGTAAIGEPPSQAATQEAAIRYLMHVTCANCMSRTWLNCVYWHTGWLAYIPSHVLKLCISSISMFLHTALSAGRSLLSCTLRYHARPCLPEIR